jgi:hypothetical protein
MKEPEHNSCFFARQASGKLPSGSGAAEHYPPKAIETNGSLAGDNHRKQFGREVTGLWGIILTVGKANKPTNKQQNH